MEKDEQRDRWNQYYKEDSTSAQDFWIEKFVKYFSNQKANSVLDIGCGAAGKVPFYKRQNWAISLIDYSSIAIELVQEKYPNVDSKIVDIRNGLPFPDEHFSIVIADLSLHYFSERKTKEILKEIKRVLSSDGLFLARVNSNGDINHDAGKGIEIEPGFFEYEGRQKRFFTEELVFDFFNSDFEILHHAEISIDRYSLRKWAWEIVANCR
ncbi:class I SAM-dependent methyltransferase [Spirochaeta cellobiosiphila]|uniref:class I SAM-dependent methyltransferase n=1 Tax=Spirochaeta cellobiosiphila TaxID=504483 RepID=UPI00040FFDF0|nr:class I SAM-dependent methyltransferase [Spirochaeta cellobiosiphila]